MTEIVWEDPPEIERGGSGGAGKWYTAAATLRDRPGEWGRFQMTSRAAAQQTMKRYKDGAYGPGFEATCRYLATDAPTLYVRYVGKPNLKAAQ